MQLVEWIALVPIVAVVFAAANVARSWWAGSPRPVLEASWEDEYAGPGHPPWEGVVLELYGRHKDVELHQVGIRRCEKARRWWRRNAGCASGDIVPIPRIPTTLKAEHSVRGSWHLDHLLDDFDYSGGKWYAWARVGRHEIWAPIRGERWPVRWWRRRRRALQARRLDKSRSP